MSSNCFSAFLCLYFCYKTQAHPVQVWLSLAVRQRRLSAELRVDSLVESSPCC